MDLFPDCLTAQSLAHQNRTIAIASGFRVDEAKSPEILQKKGFGAQNPDLFV